MSRISTREALSRIEKPLPPVPVRPKTIIVPHQEKELPTPPALPPPPVEAPPPVPREEPPKSAAAIENLIDSLETRSKQKVEETFASRRRTRLIKEQHANRLISAFLVLGCKKKLDVIEDDETGSSSSSGTPRQHNASYKGQVLACYPPEGAKNVPPHIWMSAFPVGVRFERGSAPAPVSFPFVLTNVDGSKVYGFCIRFFEQVDGKQYDPPLDLVPPVFAPMAICLLSSQAYLGTLREALCGLYAAFTAAPASPLQHSVEHYIGVLLSLPELPDSLSHVQVQFTIGSRAITYSAHPTFSLPLCDLPLYYLFEVMNMSNLLTVYTALCLEEKVVLLSSRATLLTYVAEALLTLLFPFSWQHVYIPLLPDQLLGFVQSPTPYLIGIQVAPGASMPSALTSELESQPLLIIDLDSDKLVSPRESRVDLPAAAKRVLTDALVRVLHPDMQELDNPLKRAAPAFKGSNPRSIPGQGQFNLEVQSIFVRFWAMILRNYRKHFRYVRLLPKPVLMFDRANFLKKRPLSADMLTAMLDTQLFSAFLEERKWPSSHDLFDECIATKRYLDISAAPLDGIPRPTETFTVDRTLPSSPRPPPPTYSSWPVLLQEDVLHRAETPGDLMHRLRNTVSVSNSSPKRSPGVSTVGRGSGGRASGRGSMLAPSSAAAVASGATSPRGGQDSPRQDSPRDRAATRGWRKMKTSPIPGAGDPRKEMQRRELIAVANVLVNGQAISTPETIELLRDPGMRETFINELNESRNKKLTDAAFDALAQLVSHCLAEAARTAEYRTAQLLLETVFSYHRLTPAQEAEYLHTRVRKEDIWHQPQFWEAGFFDLLEKECNTRYEQKIDEKVEEFLEKSDKEKQADVDRENNVIFEHLTTFAFRMCSLSVAMPLVQKFCDKMCDFTMLTADQAEQISILLTNIAKTMTEVPMTSELLMKQEQSTAGTLHLPPPNERKRTVAAGNGTLRRAGGGDFGTLRGELRDAARAIPPPADSSRPQYTLRSFKGHMEGVLSVEFEQGFLVSGSADHTVKIWSQATAECLGTLRGHAGWVNCLKILRAVTGELRILSGSYDNSVKVWDFEGKKLRTLTGHTAGISAMRAHGQTLVTGSYDNTARLWDYRVKKSVMCMGTHTGPVTSVDYDGHVIITASRDKTIRIWDQRARREVTRVSAHQDVVKCVRLDAAGRFVSGSADRTVRLWTIRGDPLANFEGHTGASNAVYSDSSYVVSGGSDKTVRIWDKNNAQLLHTYEDLGEEVSTCELFLDKYLLVASHESLHVLPFRSGPIGGRPLHVLTPHTKRITAVALQQNKIASASWDKEIKVWEFPHDD